MPDESKHACGLCGSTFMDDLTHGMGEGRRIKCFNCGAQFWKQRWSTKAEWEAYVNEGYENWQKGVYGIAG
jgi:DNA-directed RNA polymerase subunit RPC12/RpoP